MLTKNIKVSIIEPGAFQTHIWNKGLENIQKDQISFYSKERDVISRAANQMAAKAGNPKQVGKVILSVCLKKKPRLRYTVGRGTKSGILLKQIIPSGLLNWLIKRFLDSR